MGRGHKNFSATKISQPQKFLDLCVLSRRQAGFAPRPSDVGKTASAAPQVRTARRRNGIPTFNVVLATVLIKRIIRTIILPNSGICQ
jgi:hypothetical protein